MKLKLGINNLGISIGVEPDDGHGKEHARAVPDQTKPRGFYVYGHYDVSGNLFYVGKGTAGRAWARDRHQLWVRYVEKHLGGKYDVKIIALIGQLLKEENDEFGENGELEALDRLTMCLIKLGLASEAAQETDAYFARFKRDLLLKSVQKIKKRVEKALTRIRARSKG